MRLFFLLLFVIVAFANGAQKKIILGSFDTKSRAEDSLLKIDPSISSELKESLKSQNAALKARPSGNLYIIVIEPIEDYSKAKEIKSKLPNPYNKTGFINNYSKPTQKIETVEEKVEKNIPSLDSIYDKNDTPKEEKEEIKEQVKPKAEEKVEPKKEEIAPKEEEEKEQEKVSLTPKEEDVEELKISKTDDKPENSTQIPKKIKQKQNSFGFTNIAESFKSGVISLFSNIKNIFLNSIIYISFLLLIASGVIYFLSLKKRVILEKEVKNLKEEKEEKAMLAQNLTLDINRLKSYYNELIESFKKPIFTIRENFNRPQLDAEEVDAAKASKTLEQLLNAHEELGGEIVLDKSEFNLNIVVKNSTKKDKNGCKDDVNIVTDFELPALSKVVGDSAKVSRIFSILTRFACRHTNSGRILVALNEASQDVEGNIIIVVIVKSNKNGFGKNAIDKIKQAFTTTNSAHDSSNVHKDIEELIVAKRLIESMNGNIDFKGKENSENFFIFNIELKVINRQAMQDNFLSRKYILKSDVTLLEHDEYSSQYIIDDLESLNVTPQICKNWSDMQSRLKDVFLFIDIFILQNASLDSIDIEELIQKAKDKNFAILIIAEEDERENSIIQRTLREDVSGDESTPIIVKSLKKPYGKEEFFKLLIAIHDEQKPMLLTPSVK